MLKVVNNFSSIQSSANKLIIISYIHMYMHCPNLRQIHDIKYSTDLPQKSCSWVSPSWVVVLESYPPVGWDQAPYLATRLQHLAPHNVDKRVDLTDLGWLGCSGGLRPSDLEEDPWPW